MPDTIYMLLFGFGLILISRIAKKILEYDLIPHFWFELKKFLGFHKLTPR